MSLVVFPCALRLSNTRTVAVFGVSLNEAYLKNYSIFLNLKLLIDINLPKTTVTEGTISFEST